MLSILKYIQLPKGFYSSAICISDSHFYKRTFIILTFTMRFDTIRHNTIRYDTIRYDTIRYDTIRYDTK